MNQDLFGEVVVIKRNGSDGARFPFRTTKCTFGRNQECDIRIQLPNVSQEHAKLYVEQGKIFLQNLSEGIPTLLNKEEIETQELKHNDIFTISERSFRFELPVRRKSSSGRRSSTSRKTPLKTLQGSPRTPAAGESLKKSITKLRKSSTVVQEEDESKQTPKSDKESPKCPSPKSASLKENTPEEQLLQATPSILKKRKSIQGSERKRVSFGASLSPELFDKTLPPSTPLRKGKSPSRRLSEPIQKQSPKQRMKKRCSIGTALSEIPLVEEEEEVKEENALIWSIERPKMPTNEIPLHVVALADTPPEGLQSPLLAATCNKSDMPASDGDVASKKRKLATPVRQAIKNGVKLKETKRRLATPLRRDIKQGVSLKATKRKLATPVRQQIRSGVVLKPIRQKMHTPLRKDIHQRPQLRKVLKKMGTPLRKEIESKPQLKATKRKLATPLKKGIQRGVELRKTKPTLSADLQEEIKSRPKLKATQRKLATPLRQQIKEKPKLKATLKKMATPLRAEIKNGLKLRETKRKLSTPLRKEIESAPKLKETKKRMPGDLQDEIIKGKDLRGKFDGLPKLPEDVQAEIMSGKVLNKTLKSAPTPLRSEIIKGVTLRATKKKMRKSVQDEIKTGKELRKTKLSAPTPLKNEIKAGKQLRKTKKSAPTPFREEIKKGIKLRETKKRLAADLQDEIQQGMALKKTKIAAPTPFRNEIKKGVRLRQTKKKLDADLQGEIKEGRTLKKTKIPAPTPLRNEIKKGVRLRQTKKQLRLSLQNEIKGAKPLRPVLQKSLKTPIRAQIRAGVTLRQTLQRKSTSAIKEANLRRKSLRCSMKEKPSTESTASEMPMKNEETTRTFLRAKRRVKRLQEEPPKFSFLENEKKTHKEKTKQPAKKRVCRRSTPMKIAALRQQALSIPEETALARVHSEPDNNEAALTPKVSDNNLRRSSNSMVLEDYNDMSPVIALEPVFFAKNKEMPVPAAPHSESRVSETSGEEASFVNDIPSFSQLLANTNADNSNTEEVVPRDAEDDVYSAVDDNAQDIPDVIASPTMEEPENKQESFVEENFVLTRLLKTPKQNIQDEPVEENLGLKRLLQTPKEKTKNDVVEENFGLVRLLKTPKEKTQNPPVEENLGLKRLLKTPKEKVHNAPVEENLGLKRLMQTPKEKVQTEPVEDNFGLQRLLKTPKVKLPGDSTTVDEDFGLERIMQTPKERMAAKSTEIEGEIGLAELMKTPDSVSEREGEEDETPCLDGLMQITKMPIHAAEDVKEVITESPIEMGVLPKLFKSPKELQSPVNDLHLDNLYPEAEEENAEDHKDVAVESEDMESGRKPKPSRKKPSKVKEAVGNRSSRRQTRSKAVLEEVKKVFDGEDEEHVAVINEEDVTELVIKSDADEMKHRQLEPAVAAKVKTDEPAKEDDGVNEEKKEAEKPDVAVNNKPAPRRGRSRRRPTDVQEVVVIEGDEVEESKPDVVEEKKNVDSTGDDLATKAVNPEDLQVEEMKPVVIEKESAEQFDAETEVAEAEPPKPEMNKRTRGGRAKASTRRPTRASSCKEEKGLIINESSGQAVAEESQVVVEEAATAPAQREKRSTRSSGRKSIEQVVSIITKKLSQQAQKNEAKEKEMSVDTTKQSARGRKSASTNDAGSTKDSGIAKGVAVSPVKVHFQKTKLIAIQEETEADMQTPASKSAAKTVPSRKRKVSSAVMEKEVTENDTGDHQVVQPVRQTRHTRSLVAETVPEIVPEKKDTGRRASRSTRNMEAPTKQDDVATEAENDKTVGKGSQAAERNGNVGRATRSTRSQNLEENAAPVESEKSSDSESQAMVAEVGRASRSKRSRKTNKPSANADVEKLSKTESQSVVPEANVGQIRAMRSKRSRTVEESVVAPLDEAKTSDEDTKTTATEHRATRSKRSRNGEENTTSPSDSACNKATAIETGRRASRSLQSQRVSLKDVKVSMEPLKPVSEDVNAEENDVAVTRKRKRTAPNDDATPAMPSSSDASAPASKKSKQSDAVKAQVNTRTTRSTRSRRR